MVSKKGGIFRQERDTRSVLESMERIEALLERIAAAAEARQGS